eukprot:1809371-Prymnesium_polylepis.1
MYVAPSWRRSIGARLSVVTVMSAAMLCSSSARPPSRSHPARRPRSPASRSSATTGSGIKQQRDQAAARGASRGAAVHRHECGRRGMPTNMAKSQHGYPLKG